MLLHTKYQGVKPFGQPIYAHVKYLCDSQGGAVFGPGA